MSQTITRTTDEITYDADTRQYTLLGADGEPIVISKDELRFVSADPKKGTVTIRVPD